MADAGEDDDWTPPSAADMKIIEARQERSNQISKLMGEYMLKGYRMLDKLCHCDTILLQDRNGVDYCVACSELATECAKDDPVLSSQAARTAVMEGQSTISNVQSQNSRYQGMDQGANYMQVRPTARQCLNSTSQNESADSIDHASLSTIDILNRQIQLAGKDLQKSKSIEIKIQLCQLIKAASEAINSLENCGKS